MQEIKETTAYKKSLKGRILEAAMKAFAERGVKAVRMDDVSQMLSISKRTLYELYTDKEELLYQGVVKYDQDNRKHLTAFIEQASSVMDIIIETYQRRVVSIGSVNPQFYEDIQKYPKVVEYLNKEREHAYDQLLGFLQRGVREGYFREDVDYELVTQMFNAINTFVMNQHLLSRYSIQQVFANMLLVPLRGFCTEKGLQVIENSALTEKKQ
ncbi:MAG: TetR/AcrR family transcriptional regulator [Prevotella sp.]|nr:TetR/AcrR family transcriptional regulator [Prevotella sp.]